MGLSNIIISILNLLSFLASIPIIASGIYLASNPHASCIHLVRYPLIVLGLLVLLVSLAGFVGAYYNRQRLLAAYLVLMAILIVLLLALLVFSFVVSRNNSNWLRRYVGDDRHWVKIRDCVIQSDVCGKIGRDDQFIRADLSPIQSGCCEPPTSCGYVYVNPTMWVSPVNVGADPDCYAWSNDQTQLCYGCNSCKAGTIGNLHREWRTANIVLIVATVVLIWVYIIGCCALKNAQTEELFRRYKQGFA